MSRAPDGGGRSADVDIDQLRQWIGRERSVRDDMSPFPARALGAALGRDASPDAGAELPPCWHWLYFLDTPAASATGADGHPRLGSFLPPVPLPRRMWAAGSFAIEAPLVLGSPATRRTVIRSVESKSGRSGALVFVTLEHEVSQQGRTCIREQQQLVYREAPTAGAAMAPGQPPTGTADYSRSVEPDPVLLFRYSALTYNSHRIHYDRRYAMEREGYAGLVVQGPLLVTLLLELARERDAAARVRECSFRALRPTLDLAPFRLQGRREAGKIELWSLDHEGCLGMTATVGIA